MIFYIEGKETPLLIQAIQIQSMVGQKLVNSRMVDEAKEKYPEYFEDELAREQLYNSIPKKVHKAYNKEFTQEVYRFDAEMREDGKPGGIFYWFQHPEEHAKYRERWERLYPISKKIQNEIWDKHYGPYGYKRLQ